MSSVMERANMCVQCEWTTLQASATHPRSVSVYVVTRARACVWMHVHLFGGGRPLGGLSYSQIARQNLIRGSMTLMYTGRNRRNGRLFAHYSHRTRAASHM